MPGNVLTAKITVDTTGVAAAFEDTADGAKKAKAALTGTDAIIGNIVGSAQDLNDALNKLASQGLVSVNSLQVAIQQFKDAFANATNPADIKKFGDALKVLQTRQQELINSGLGIVEADKKVSQSHATHSVATQKLSTTVLGLSKAFEILPPELAHLTHGFEQIFQVFERTTQGTEGAGDSIKKFAGVLGEVGLGLAIGLVVGLLADFVKGLFDVEKGLGDAAVASSEFGRSLDDQKKSIDDFKEGISDLNKLAKSRIDINTAEDLINAPAALQGVIKLKAGLLDLEGTSGENRKLMSELGDETVRATENATKAFHRFQELAGNDIQVLFTELGNVEDVLAAINSKQPIKNKNGVLLSVDATEKDKILIEDVKKSSDALIAIQKQSVDAEKAQVLLYNSIEKQKLDILEEANKKTKELLRSRAEIIKEFTAKFASIGDPFPDFLTKGLPLGHVEDKLLRAGLDEAFKIMESGVKTLRNQAVQLNDIPLIPGFKLADVGKTDLVRQIEDKFGDLKKETENAVNKGIFEIPIDFKIAPEGDGKALKVAEDLADSFVKTVESITGQKNARLDISTEFLATLDLAKVRDEVKKVVKAVEVVADGVQPVVKINAKGDVTVDIDEKKIGSELAEQINSALQTFATDAFSGFGEALGDALSNLTNGDGIKAIVGALSGLLASVGKALIRAGVLYSGIGKALKAFAKGNPALAIGLGIALVALAKVLSNSVQKAGARALGGPVSKGKYYEVNERGRELFQPNHGKPFLITGGRQVFTPPVSGKIIPHWQTEKILKNNSLGAQFKSSISNAFGKISGHRVGGGGVTAGNNYIVNESGAEIFIPSGGQSIKVNSPSGNVAAGIVKVEVFGRFIQSGKEMIATIATSAASQRRLT